ncbi:MAG: fumarylacetoacetate hydrolase family protein [Thermodesulfobacteriota bacterium]|nr:fumarylacetoacetate hydrolase family protein [Thermodesulfobacteriota bacterium]
MRLISYKGAEGPSLGVLTPKRKDHFTPVSGLHMLELIRSGAAGLERVKRALKEGSPLPLSSISLLAPIPHLVRNVFCLGWNYAEHSRETAQIRGLQAKTPERPIFFTKATTTVNGPYDDIPVDSMVSEQIDWEVELGVIIGSGGKNIPRQKALEHVFGYTVINDVSARDVQSAHGKQFFKGKSLDGYCPMGPWVVTPEEIAEPHGLDLYCRVNGVLKQEGNTGDMVFDIPSIIEWLSLGMTLLPGDVIATGTPAGVGFARTPPEYLTPGDVVECTVEGIGTLRNGVVAIG